MFSRIGHILGHKTKLRDRLDIKYFSIHKDMQIEINYTRTNGEAKNTGRQNNMLLTSNRPIKKLKRKPKNISRQMKMEHNFPKSMRCRKSNSKREVFRDTRLT